MAMPRQARTIPMPGHKDHGEGEDNERWYRCWNCGVPCDVRREWLGDENSQAQIGYLDEQTNSLGVLDGYPESIYIMNFSPSSFGNASAVLLELDGSGDAKGIRHSFEVQPSPGCWFCHSPNWRGDFK